MVHENISLTKAEGNKAHVLIGTIVAVGSIEEDTPDIGTANVDIDSHGLVENVPIFYHCEGDKAASAGGFKIGDRVLVLNNEPDISTESTKIVGYEDGLPKSCGWRFKLFRDDDTTIRDEAGNITTPSGTIITPQLLNRLRIHNSEMEDVCRIEGGEDLEDDFDEYWTLVDGIWFYEHESRGWSGTYNISTGYFTVNFKTGYEPVEGATYWVNFDCKHGIDTQYPYIYKYSEQYKEDGRISPGLYQANVPYWEVGDYFYEPVPIDLGAGTITCDEYTVFARQTDSPFNAYWRDNYARNRQLRSSVPYFVSYAVNKSSQSAKAWMLSLLDPCGDPLVCGNPYPRIPSIRYISSDGAFNKLQTEMGIWGELNTADSGWNPKPDSIEIAVERSLTVVNLTPHGSYSYDCDNDPEKNIPTTLDHIVVDHYWRNVFITFEFEGEPI